MTYTVLDSIDPSDNVTRGEMQGALPVIYCEGKDDVTFLKKYINLQSGQYSLVPVAGKPKLLEILESQSSFPRIGLIDADFDHILGLNKNIVELHLSDHHDIEVDLILSDTFRKNVQYLYNYDLKKRIQDIYEKCFNLSLSKYVNSKNDLRLSFKDLKCRNWYGKTTEELVDKLLSFEKNKSHNKQSLLEIVQKYKHEAKSLCPKQFHNGKDLFKAIHYELREYLKTLPKEYLKTLPKRRQPQSDEDLKTVAIIAFSGEDFQRMSFFKGLKNFAESHKLNIFLAD